MSYELTVEEQNERKTINYYKGYIIGLSVERGMRWSSERKANSKEFEQGFEDGKNSRLGYSKDYVTLVHIVYNGYRHQRPHLQSAEADDKHLKRFSHYSKDLPVPCETSNIEVQHA
jgi:hypothetical protein